MNSSSLISKISLLYVVITFLFLLIDSFYNPASSLKYIGVDSRLLYYIFIVIQISCRFFDRSLLPQKFVQFNNKVIFPITATVFISLAIINGLQDQFYLFRLVGLNIENLKYLFYLSGFIFLTNIQASWLKSKTEKFIYFGGLLFWIALISLEILLPDVYTFIVREDSLLETIQTLFYFTAGILFLLVSRNYFKNKQQLFSLFFIGLSLLMIFVAGEEISWGQRIFSIETPENLAQINLQNETTIHNIDIFQSNIDYIYMAIGLWGSIGGITIKALRPRLYKKYAAIFPPAILFFYFFAVTRFYFVNLFVIFDYQLFSFERIGVARWQEMAETLLAFGFLAFSWFRYKQLKSSK